MSAVFARSRGTLERRQLKFRRSPAQPEGPESIKGQRHNIFFELLNTRKTMQASARSQLLFRARKGDRCAALTCCTSTGDSNSAVPLHCDLKGIDVNAPLSDENISHCFCAHRLCSSPVRPTGVSDTSFDCSIRLPSLPSSKTSNSLCFHLRRHRTTVSDTETDRAGSSSFDAATRS